MSTYQDLQNNLRLLKIYQQRLEIIKLIRDFFHSQNFLETDTPIAIKYPGQEPYLNPVPVLFHDPNNIEAKFYLQTSPEFAMKKLLAVGLNNIFQVCKCFRDYESWGGNHNIEFTMIEWYRSPGVLAEIMDDTEKLFKFVVEKLGVNNIKYKDRKTEKYRDIEIMGKWECKSMKELWQEYVGVNLDDYVTVTYLSVIARNEAISSVGSSESELEEKRIKNNLRELCQKLGYQTSDNDEYEDLFYKIFLNKIEPYLGLDKPIFVYDYPACMCSLSKLCEYDNRYAQRFELYIGGLELANAFGELIDARTQKTNLVKDVKLRKKLNKEIWPIDDNFISALNDIKQETAGIALGVDRMVLLFTGANDLNEVVFQSVSDQTRNF